ncbi:hypothetical protein K8R43_05520 [archaeon]|nr:hypothetical protein [archaeon]
MPEGIPRTDEERREKHKETYGTEDIPEQRKGQASKKKAMSWAEALLTAVLLFILLLLLADKLC